jgi:hypothetical protein
MSLERNDWLLAAKLALMPDHVNERLANRTGTPPVGVDQVAF